MQMNWSKHGNIFATIPSSWKGVTGDETQAFFQIRIFPGHNEPRIWLPGRRQAAPLVYMEGVTNWEESAWKIVHIFGTGETTYMVGALLACALLLDSQHPKKTR